MKVFAFILRISSNIHRPFHLERKCCVNMVLPMFLCLLMDFTVNRAFAISSSDLCATKVCSGCIAGSLSCQEGGLTNLPDELSKDIQSVIFIGHQFNHNELSRRNFSNFPLQTKQLQRLVIRNCGIQRVYPGTFQPLPNITQLDLSQNKLSVIEANTFIGLKLEFLRLDENRGLTLAAGAFSQTSIVSLSMNHCELKSLTYEDLLPLFQTGALANLHLTGNKLFTLESNLEPILLGLHSLSIEHNPFLCDCKLKWMVPFLQRRAARRTARGLELISDAGLDSVPLDEDTLKPVCREPHRLTGKPVEKLNPNDFFCEPPIVKSLEIDFRSMKSKSIISASGLAVTLRCEVKGSPELQISWYRKAVNKLHTNANNDGEYVKSINASQSGNAGITEILLNRRVQHHDSANLGVETKNHERFACLASDLNGNTSIEFALKWPPSLLSEPATHQKETAKRTVDQNKLPNSHDSMQDKQTKVSQAMPDWYFLTGEDPSGFWLQKQFSALQMIGAVVGTFTITLIVFAIGCCLLRSSIFRKTCFHPKYHIQSPSNYIHASPNCKYSSPPSYTYAPPQSTNSNLHPQTNSNYTESLQIVNNQLQQPMNSPNQYILNGHNNTLQTKRLPYATYEPVSGTVNLHSGTYSESQTYDLPTCSMNIGHPAFPLPPIPVVANPNSMLNNCFFVPKNRNQLENGTMPRLAQMSDPNQMLLTLHNGNTLGHFPRDQSLNMHPNGLVHQLQYSTHPNIDMNQTDTTNET